MNPIRLNNFIEQGARAAARQLFKGHTMTRAQIEGLSLTDLADETDLIYRQQARNLRLTPEQVQAQRETWLAAFVDELHAMQPYSPVFKRMARGLVR